MNTELEDSLVEALRRKAEAVPPSRMPRLGQPARAARPMARRGRLVPIVAAVAAVVGIAGGVVALVPDERDGAPSPAGSQVPRLEPETPRAGDVYYLRSVRELDPDRSPHYVQVELWQSTQRTGPWRSHTISGDTIDNGRVVPDDLPPENESGACYPFEAAKEVGCKQRPSWQVYPSLEFLAAAPRDPAALGRQLHDAAYADAQRYVNEGSLPPDELSTRNVAIRELGIVQVVLSGNGVSAELRAALHEVVASLPGITATDNVRDRLGRPGTGYHYGNDPEQVAIFDGDTYLGSRDEAFVYGIARGPGKAPYRTFGTR
jgi:hypothetical protein